MHRSLVVVTALALSACSAPSGPLATAAATRAQAVVNGAPYAISDRPSALALLGDFGGFAQTFCTGTLIASDTVMTAAHCLAAIDTDFAGAEIYVAPDAELAFIAGAPADAVRMRSFVIHPAYDPNVNPTPDVGLLFLDEAITDIAPSAVLRPDEAGHLQPGQIVEVVGWGLRTPQGNDGGEKFGALTALQVIAPQLYVFGTPVGEDAAVNKCNGDSGGPSFLTVGGVSRVIGIASRSDCQTVTLDSRADAFASFFDAEMTALCADGGRASCAIPGLPTAAQLGAGTLPSPAPLANARGIPASLVDDLDDAAATLAGCFGIDDDEGIAALYLVGFGLGADACTDADIATGAAYYGCIAAASCDELQGNDLCPNETSDAEAALSACSDLFQGPVDPVDPPTGDVDPPLADAIDAYCLQLQECGLFDGTLQQCRDALVDQLTDVLNADCARAELLLADMLDCASNASCDALATEEDPDGCFGAVSDEEFADAFGRCDDLDVGEGEGEGEPGEGEGEPGEGEGEGEPGEGEGEEGPRTRRDDDDDDDSDERDPPLLSCASAGGPAAGWAALGLVLLRRRRR